MQNKNTNTSHGEQWMINKADTSSDDRLKWWRRSQQEAQGRTPALNTKQHHLSVHRHDNEERKSCMHGVTAFSQPNITEEVDGWSRWNGQVWADGVSGYEQLMKEKKTCMKYMHLQHHALGFMQFCHANCCAGCNSSQIQIITLVTSQMTQYTLCTQPCSVWILKGYFVIHSLIAPPPPLQN